MKRIIGHSRTTAALFVVALFVLGSVRAEAGLWDDATDLGNGWRELSWFGVFNINNDPWIFHTEHEWLTAYGTTTSDITFWDDGMKAFWWTSDTVYPYVYRFSDEAWLFYQVDSINPRWFYNYSTAKWEAWPGSGPTAATQYDVGYNTEVSLDASIVPTVGMTEPMTYAWEQTGGEEVTLSAADVMMPTFTTLPIWDFVHLDEDFGLVGIDTLAVDESSYGFEVVVTGGSISRVGQVTVTSGSVSLALPAIPLGVIQYVKASTFEHPEFEWSLVSAPEGSTAELINADQRVAGLRPDLPGQYLIRDDISGEGLILDGATYVGVDTCALCHGEEPVANLGLEDMVTPWSMTGHADMLVRGLDGTLSSHYNEGCVKCHTVGYFPDADNDGFDDLARDYDWTFPEILEEGNYAAMPVEVQALANIQCESCHGPGSSHPGASSASLNVTLCSTCHNDGHYHNRPAQWEISPHNEAYLEVSEYAGGRSSCARCHSPGGFVDTQKGEPVVRMEAGKLTCQTCHDPHNIDSTEHQLRVVDSVELANGVVIDGIGTSATCVYCHNARRGPTSYLTSTPHGGTKAELFYGVNGFEYGGSPGVFVHSLLADCVDCHMAANPGSSDPLHNKIGDHTFSMTYLEGETLTENIAICNECHSDVEEFDYAGAAFNDDVDGDGENNGVQTEVNGLIQIVFNKIVATGVTALPSYPYWSGFSEDADEKAAQRAAIWNHDLVKNDKSHGVHNPQYAIWLLQTSYSDLSQTFGGDDFATAFPLADLR